jgi:hypothetical protein
MARWPEQPSRKRILLWLFAGTVVLAATLVIFASGNGSPPGRDVRIIEGEEPPGATQLPIDASLADIVEADVRREATEIVFEVTVASTIPEELERSSLEFRFDLSEAGRNTWIVSGSVTVAVTAAVVSQVTDYQSSTIDGSMPGSVAVDGETLTIRLEPQRIDDFPANFEWALTSNLIAFRDIPGSTRVEDYFPSDGTLSFNG